jgi:hypothetical protein
MDDKDRRLLELGKNLRPNVPGFEKRMKEAIGICTEKIGGWPAVAWRTCQENRRAPVIILIARCLLWLKGFPWELTKP